MTPRPFAALALAAALLAGCSIVGSSPKTQFFILSAVKSAAPAPAARIAPITVTEFHVPTTLDRREMVRRTGENRLEVEGTDRWGAPLGDMARSVLSQDLANRLSANTVVAPTAAAPDSGVRYLAVAVSTFMPEANGETVLDVDWSLLPAPGAPPAIQRHAHITVAGGGAGPADQARAMSAALGRLADTIVKALAEG